MYNCINIVTICQVNIILTNIAYSLFVVCSLYKFDHKTNRRIDTCGITSIAIVIYSALYVHRLISSCNKLLRTRYSTTVITIQSIKKICNFNSPIWSFQYWPLNREIISGVNEYFTDSLKSLRFKKIILNKNLYTVRELIIIKPIVIITPIVLTLSRIFYTISTFNFNWQFSLLVIPLRSLYVNNQ